MSDTETAPVITGEGIYDLSDEVYHADPCAVPSLSSSIGKMLVEKTAKHAYMAHPRLNPAYEAENKHIYDLGSAAHALILGEPHKVRVLYGIKEYRKDVDKAARDECYAAGVIPIKEDDWDDVQAMAKGGRLQLDRHRDAHGAFKNGKPEQTLIWREDNGVWCRARLDWLNTTPANVFYDLKSTGVDVGPDDWGARTMFDIGADFQDAFYSRGIRKLLGLSDPQLHFVVIQNKSPYPLAVHALQPETRAMAAANVEQAIDYWGWCTRHNAWPGWSKDTYYNAAPPWVAIKSTERQVTRQIAHDEKIDLYATMLDWQAPNPGKPK